MEIFEMINLLAGVAFFLFGMTLMGEGLQRVSGGKWEPILFRVSRTPIRGILLGIGVTAVIQSSSATSVMAVGFVNARMMKVRQAIPIILGAIVGTSITGWIICLGDIHAASGLSRMLSTSTLTGVIAIAGILPRMFSKNPTYRHLGEILLGFSLLMFGLSHMSHAVSGLKEAPWFAELLTSVAHPLIGILAGLVFAAMLQSASAAVGMIQALSFTGVVTLGAALPLLMGITIGASLPVLLAALNASAEGKRTAVSYLVATSIGVTVFASIFYFIHWIVSFSFLSQMANPVSLAFANTILRVMILLLLAPFADLLEYIAAGITRKYLPRSEREC